MADNPWWPDTGSLLLALLAASAVAPGARAERAPYLRALGPAEVRLMKTPALMATAWQLPPLRLQDVAALPPTNAVAASATAAATGGPGDGGTNSVGSTNAVLANTSDVFGPYIPPELAAMMGWISSDTAGLLSSNAPPPPPPPVVLDSAPTITPQMLVQFFKPSPANTNATNTATAVLVPGPFLPPQAPPRSSSATYRSQ